MRPNFSKLTDMLFGVAIGDALFMPFEFDNAKVSTFDEQFRETVLPRRWTEPIRLEAGQIGDDGEQTILTARAVANGLEQDEQIAEMLKWADSNSPCMGRTTRLMIGSIRTVEDYYDHVERLRDRNPDVFKTQANGSLMRCSPLVVHATEDLPYRVAENTVITHPSAENVATNLVYLTGLQHILRDETPDMVVEYLKENYSSLISTAQDAYSEVTGWPAAISDTYIQDLQQALTQEHRNITYNRGWALHGLWGAIAATVRADTYMEGVSWIGRREGDTDTNAAIAGAWLGVRYKPPQELIDQIITKNYELVPRPTIYHPRQIPMLGLKLAAV